MFNDFMAEQKKTD